MDTFTETRIKIPSFSFSRIWTIAAGTMTQLVRMKTFYFLLLFALILAAIGYMDFKLASPTVHLQTIKKISFGAMDTFAWLYAIVATALLIPRDLEDRTLYTILSKPVRRIEYLVGKLFGVLILIAISLALMFCACMLMLWIKQIGFQAETIEMFKSDPRVAQAVGKPEMMKGLQVELDEQMALISNQGVKKSLSIAALASFLKASVVAAMAILISTFASSSLFTIISSIFFFLIGHAHGMMTDFWVNLTDGNRFIMMITKILKLLIPDYQLFSFSEGIVSGGEVVPRLVYGMCALTGGYLFVFLLISLMIFLYKEF